MLQKLSVFAVFIVCVVFAFAAENASKPDQSEKLANIHLNKPWTGGTPEEAMAASKSGGTIPMFTYSIIATNDPLPRNKKSQPRTGTMAGTSPFAPPLSNSTIPAVIVPTIIKIGTATFDPTVPTACDAAMSPIDRFNLSPLVQPVPDLTFNNMNVGNVQYTNGIMRAEFWNTIGANPAYSNSFSFSTTSAFAIDATAYGTTTSGGCGTIGVVSEGSLGTQLRNKLAALTTAGIVSTTKVVFFLTAGIAQSTTNPPSLPGTPGCCIGGYHTAQGSPPQVWAIMDYNNRDTTIASHELAELMNDPLGGNQTPAWGAVGQVPAGSCQGNLEVGDPLTGTRITLPLNNYNYQLQEMAFFSWFFNAPGTASLGAGGVFSSNGTFQGPAKACPTGGTY